MVVSNIEIVTILVTLLFGAPIFWNIQKSDLIKSFTFIRVIRIINKSLKIQGLIGVVLLILTWVWTTANFKFDGLLISVAYTYLVVGFFMYLPSLVGLNFIKFLIEKTLEKQKNSELKNLKKDVFDKNFRSVILDTLKEKLGRNLTPEEIETFSMPRSGIAYEMILDFISDQEKSKIDIEKYVYNVVLENKKTTHNKGFVQ